MGVKLSLIIPFYCEEQQIPITLATVGPILRDLTADYEIILIDDGSDDGTWSEILQQAASDHRIRGIRFSRNFGKEAAICAGLDQATGDAVILMDGDLQHPPAYLPQMVAKWQAGYEVVEGIKSNRGKETLASRLNARLFYGTFKLFSGYDLNNASDFKLLDRKVVDVWRSLGEKDTFFRGLSVWLGFKRTTFTFEVAERTTGISKWPVFKLLRLSLNAITGFSAAPLYLISAVGLILVVAFIILGIQTLINWFIGHAAGGFTTVILLQLLIGGATLISLGLIGVYIARIFNEVKDRPRYIIRETTTDSNPE